MVTSPEELNLATENMNENHPSSVAVGFLYQELLKYNL